MGGLIPLVLQPALLSAPLSIRASALSSNSVLLPSSSKRLPPPIQTEDLFKLPYTPEEWRAELEEVKVMYLEGQYKQCSSRCIQLLEDANGPVCLLIS